MRYSESLTIPIELDRAAGLPLRDQITQQFAAAIAAGALAPGARIPSTRGLADILRVSRGVAAEAYTELESRGLVHTRTGSGTYVTGAATSAVAGLAAPDAPVKASACQPPELAFPVESWRSAWRHASHRLPEPHGAPPLGLAELRRALADHLVGTRGLPPTGHTVVVTAGRRHGLELAGRLSGLPREMVALEQPADSELAGWVQENCAAVIPLPVDEHGAYFGAVASACRAAVICPDGSVPFGHRLTARRSSQAREWAVANAATLIEVADSRVIRSREPSAGPANGARSFLVGDFAKLISPALGIGYLTLPRELAPAATELIAEQGAQPSAVAQMACAQLLASGTVRRHMQRLARSYAARRVTVQRGLAPLRSRCRIYGADALDTIIVRLPPGADAAAVAASLHDQGVRVDPLDNYYLSGSSGMPALVLGYGQVTEDRLRRTLRQLRTALSGPVLQSAVSATIRTPVRLGARS